MLSIDLVTFQSVHVVDYNLRKSCLFFFKVEKHKTQHQYPTLFDVHKQ